MKRVFSVLIILSILLGMTSALASGDSSWIYTYQGFTEWIGSGSTYAGLCIDPENFGEFAWPNDATTLTASVEKTLSFSPHPDPGRGSWSVPSNMTIHGVDLDYGSVQGAIETSQLTVAGNWNGDINAHKNFTLTGSVLGNVRINGNSAFDLTGEIDGDVTMRNASATMDLTKVKNLHIFETCALSGNLKAEGLTFGGYLDAEHTLTLQSGSQVEITGNRSGGEGDELIVVEKGATLTLSGATYANITVKDGGVLNLLPDGNNYFDLINAHLHIEEGGLVNAYNGILVYYSDYYGDKSGKITGSGTVCFWNDAEEYLPKRYYRYEDSVGESEYATNDGNVPRVDATVKFASAVCEHERGDNPWILYEDSHAYLCCKCNREIDGGLHSYTGADVLVTTGGSTYTCKQCGYVKTSGVFWEIKNGVLSIQGAGDIPFFSGGAKKTPWYDKRARIERIVIGDGVTGIDTSFAEYTNLTSVQISGDMTYLSAQLLNGCSALKYVELPAGLENISTGAFQGCTALTDVFFAGTQEQWDNVMIGRNNDALSNATVHVNTPTLRVTTQTTDVQTIVTVTPSNLAVDTVVILGCYRNHILTEVQSLPYQGEPLVFPVTCDFHTLKVMAWEDMTQAKALCTSIIR